MNKPTIDGKYDWEQLKEQFKNLPSLETMTVTLPKDNHIPSSQLRGYTDGLYPIREPLIKTENISQLNKELIHETLDEAIAIMDKLNNMTNEVLGNHSHERFRVKSESFTQHMDKDDNAHILWLDPEIKKRILDENLVGVNPWVEVFTIDGNYCHFTNQHGKAIGRIRLKTNDYNRWTFESILANGEVNKFDCTKPYPYDCEREVIKWMVENDLFNYFKDLK